MADGARGLELVSDDFGRAMVIGGVRVLAGRSRRPPFAVQAQVVEEDTHLVLGADAAFAEPAESVAETVEAMERWRPPAPGSVLVRRGRPLRVLAVVHDLDRDPTWNEAWVATALAGALREADRRGAATVALPPLGAAHGRMPAAGFARMLWDCLDAGGWRSLRRVWLDAGRTEGERVLATLRTLNVRRRA